MYAIYFLYLNVCNFLRSRQIKVNCVVDHPAMYIICTRCHNAVSVNLQLETTGHRDRQRAHTYAQSLHHHSVTLQDKFTKARETYGSVGNNERFPEKAVTLCYRWCRVCVQTRKVHRLKVLPYHHILHIASTHQWDDSWPVDLLKPTVILLNTFMIASIQRISVYSIL